MVIYIDSLSVLSLGVDHLIILSRTSSQVEVDVYKPSDASSLQTTCGLIKFVSSAKTGACVPHDL